MTHIKVTRSAFTLVEILLAMAILVATMVPVFFFMTKGASDTDLNASKSFAVSRASDILNAMLDNVPFQALRQGIPGFIRVDDLKSVKGYEKFDDAWAEKFIKTVFPGSSKTATGYPCTCIIKDPRGIHYKITLRVEDISSPPSKAIPELKKIGEAYPTSPPSDFSKPANDEPTFSYLKNPTRLLSMSWNNINYLPNPVGMMPSAGEYRFEIELPGQVSHNPENFYTDQGYSKIHPNAPRFINPTATRLTQRMARTEVQYTKDDNFRYCGFKRLIIEVQWNIDKPHLKDPEAATKGLKRIHLITIKADINV